LGLVFSAEIGTSLKIGETFQEFSQIFTNPSQISLRAYLKGHGHFTWKERTRLFSAFPKLHDVVLKEESLREELSRTFQIRNVPVTLSTFDLETEEETDRG